MFNILHPQRLVAVSSSSSQQICEEAIQVTGKNKKARGHRPGNPVPGPG